MRRTLLAALVAMSFAADAEAGQRACHGAATGAAGDVRVVLIVEDGKAAAGLWRWIPPAEPGSSFGSRIVLERRYTDLENGLLSEIQVVQVANVAQMNPPQLDHAVVAVGTESAGPATKPWRMYEEAAATIRAGGIPKGMPKDGGPANFVGVIAFSRQDPGGAQLLASVNTAATVSTRVSDRSGQTVISRGRFSLAGRAIAEATGREARRLARAAAARPMQQCEPLDSRPKDQAAGEARQPPGPG